MIILASNSPRRKDILKEYGYDFSVIKSRYEESGGTSDPITTALKFAKGKAKDVFNALKKENRTRGAAVIGADTVVYYDGAILGKPKDAHAAEKTLKTLSGKEHEVITAFAVLSEKSEVYGYDVSKVKFNELSDSLIKDYVATGKPLDKAGSYGVQDGFDIVAAVEGSVYNVIGLPIEKLKPILDLFSAENL